MRWRTAPASCRTQTTQSPAPSRPEWLTMPNPARSVPWPAPPAAWERPPRLSLRSNRRSPVIGTVRVAPSRVPEPLSRADGGRLGQQRVPERDVRQGQPAVPEQDGLLAGLPAGPQPGDDLPQFGVQGFRGQPAGFDVRAQRPELAAGALAPVVHHDLG